jgi:hypothetical protein
VRACKLNQCNQGREDCPDPEQCAEYEGTYTDRLIGFALCVVSALTVLSFLVYVVGV